MLLIKLEDDYGTPQEELVLRHIHFPPTDPPLPYTGIYDEDGRHIVSIDGKWVDVRTLFTKAG